MCGICGFVVKNLSCAGKWRRVLGDMTQSLAHRGPDGSGFFYTDEGDSIVGFGHRRLSIIDLSEAANQPIGNEDDTVIVVSNGEIYNYEELTRELKSKGHKFRSRSDTEVIVHLYEEMGYRCIERLDGMFAFALWDRKECRLLLVRDRMGIKPLFYSFKDGNLYFSSEIKALLDLPDTSREIDFKSLDSYFSFGYITKPGTIFKDIKKLPPSSYLTFQNRQVTIKPYWSVQYLPKHNMSENELMDELLNMFGKAVKRHLVSDVPLGALLSGGVDSSIIVAMMSRIGGKTVDTFSLGYDTGGRNELEYATAVANYYKTNHHEFRVNPEMTQILPELLWHLDEPFFDNSIIPTYYISKLAGENVKVVLSGDGGDEIFGGYEWTRRHQYQMAYKRLPKVIRKIIANWVVPSTFEDEYGTAYTQRACRLLRDLNTDMEAGFLRRTSVSYQFRQRLYSNALKDTLAGFDAADHQGLLFLEAQVSDVREKMLYVDTMSFLPEDCLFKVDRMSMANALEVRVPFLDRELVEFAARIPFEYKIRNLTSKYILKKAFSPYLPKKIFKQRKQGFTIPISSWLRGELGALAEKILLSDSLRQRGLFKQNHLKWMLEEHRKGKQELGHRIWSLVVFEIWARLYLDEKINSKPDFSLEEMIG